MSEVSQIPVGFNYVLILEWLAAGDDRTGAQLHEFLQAADIPAELVVCESWADVQQALETATLLVRTKGVPAIQLETHGSNPWVGRSEDIGFGPEASSAVPWAQLGVPLSRLNVASDFRLFFVSAACWGSGVMGAISGGERPAPFAAAVGFRTSVMTGRLRDAVKELYRSLLGGLSIRDSVASAQRELNEGQELQLEIAAEIAAKMLWNVYYKQRASHEVPVAAPEIRLQRARQVWDSWFPASLQARVPAYRFEATRIGTDR